MAIRFEKARRPQSDLRTALRESDFRHADRWDPIKFYSWPALGKLYRKRVELCLDQCPGGANILEVGFGSGVTFPLLRHRYQRIHGLDLTSNLNGVRQFCRQQQIDAELINGDVCDMPYEDDTFDTVLLISILEHLKAEQLRAAMAETRRVIAPGGRLVYGVPADRWMMAVAFRLLGCPIREHHFSTENDVSAAAEAVFGDGCVYQMRSSLGLGLLYEVGVFGRDANEDAT